MRNRSKLIVTLVVVLALLSGYSSQVIQSIWNGSNRFSIIVNSEPLILISVEPRTQKAILLSIPPNTILNVPSGFSEYKASSVYELGQLEKKKNGGQLLARAIENTFGIAVDRFISPKNSKLYLSLLEKETLKKIKQDYFSFMGLPKSIIDGIKLKSSYDTDITFLEMYHLWNSIRKLRIDQINFANGSESHVFVSYKLPDQTEVLRVDDEILDTLTGSKFEDQNIRTENVTITIINATEKNKLATLLGRILKNLGANVLIRSTATNPENYSCLINYSQQKFAKSLIVLWMKRKYDCRILYDKDMISQTDVKIYLGTAFLI